MKRKVLAVLMAVAVAVMILPAEAMAQKKGRSEADDYNLQKAYEVLNEDKNDTDTALELLKKQIEITPDNVEALMLRGKIYLYNDNYALALTNFNNAMRFNKPKKSGIFNSSIWMWKAYAFRDAGDDLKAEECMAKAVELCRKDNRKNLPDMLNDYAQDLFINGKFDEADAVYAEMLEIDEGRVQAIVGQARNQIARENYASAINLLKKCRQLAPDYTEIDYYEALAYDGNGDTDKAIDSALKALENDINNLDETVGSILKKHKSYAIARLRSMIKGSDNPTFLKAVLAGMLEANKEYEDAIIAYMKLSKMDGIDTRRKIADCLSELGLYGTALGLIDDFLKEYPENSSALSSKGDILKSLGRYDEALGVYGKLIEVHPDYAFGYYAKGWCYELMGDDAEAMKLYETGIDIDNSYPYIFLMRGEMRQKTGNKEGAEEDFRMVTQIDTSATDGSCRMYALHFLGKDDEAMEWMQKVIDENPDDAGVWYDKTCLLCRMGRGDEAVEAMRTCFAKGYANFEHIRADDDLDLIRERDDFKALVEEYTEKIDERKERFSKILDKEIHGENDVHGVTEVAFNRRGKGTFEVPCSVNGLELNMIFDTGASDVTISSVEANFMLKNGQLSREDIKGKKYYQIASGEIAEGTMVTLKEVKIGDAVLHNVDASVVHNQKAPLLLGQSVLERFGTITIDNINSKLLIKQ